MGSSSLFPFKTTQNRVQTFENTPKLPTNAHVSRALVLAAVEINKLLVALDGVVLQRGRRPEEEGLAALR